MIGSDRAQGSDENTAAHRRLTVVVVLAVPADALELWSEQRLDERLERRTVSVRNREVQQPERAGDHRPYARVLLAPETSHEPKELLNRHRAGQRAGPRVGDDPEPLERHEAVEADQDGVEQLVLVAKPVDATTSGVEYEHPSSARHANGFLAQQHVVES
jgi:hypothetical protein